MKVNFLKNIQDYKERDCRNIILPIFKNTINFRKLIYFITLFIFGFMCRQMNSPTFIFILKYTFKMYCLL